MTDERDELAQVIESGYGEDPTDCPYDHAPAIADAILAAGYTKPRQVTTVEELDALPVGSVILEASGTATQAVSRKDDQNWWFDGPGMSGSLLIPLPATVLYSPATA